MNVRVLDGPADATHRKDARCGSNSTRAIARRVRICSAGHMEPGQRELDLIIFDCDGVLVDIEVLSCRCLSEALADCGVKLELSDALELFLGRSAVAVLQHFGAQGRTLPDSFLPDLKARVRAAF